MLRCRAIFIDVCYAANAVFFAPLLASSLNGGFSGDTKLEKTQDLFQGSAFEDSSFKSQDFFSDFAFDRSHDEQGEPMAASPPQDVLSDFTFDNLQMLHEANLLAAEEAQGV